MGRGGKRAGAGRKPLLDAEVARCIRRDCEQRANEFRREQAYRRHERRMEKRGVIRSEDGEPDPVHMVLKEDRPQVVKFGVEDPDNTHLPEALSAEARSAIDFMRRNRKWFGAYSEPLPRLANGRQQIICAVASDWGLSPRMVREIWEADEPV